MRVVARWDLLAETDEEAVMLAEFHRQLYESKAEKVWVLPLPKPSMGRLKGLPSGLKTDTGPT